MSARGRVRNGGPGLQPRAPSSCNQECRFGAIASTSDLRANPVFRAQPIPLCWGPAVPALGIGLPFPVWRCAGVNTEQAPSLGVLKVSSSRCLHDWRATRCSQASTSLPRDRQFTQQRVKLARYTHIADPAVRRAEPRFRCSCHTQPSRLPFPQSTNADYTQQRHH